MTYEQISDKIETFLSNIGTIYINVLQGTVKILFPSTFGNALINLYSSPYFTLRTVLLNGIQ